MSLTYRCGRCGLGCNVVSGALGLTGEYIHCPRCGARAEADSEWDDTLEIVQVSVSKDGRTTHELQALTRDTGRFDDPTYKASPEEQAEALSQFDGDEDAESVAPRLPSGSDELLRNTQRNVGRAVFSHTGSTKGEPSVVGGELTPPGSPSVAFASSTGRHGVDIDATVPNDEMAKTARMPSLGAGIPERETPTRRVTVEADEHRRVVEATHRRFPATRVSGEPKAKQTTETGTDKQFPVPAKLPIPQAEEAPQEAAPSEQPSKSAGNLGRTASDMAMAVFGPTEPMPKAHRPDRPDRPDSNDPAWHTKGLEGKAWSSMVVRQALSESGVEPSDEVPSLPEGTPTETLRPLPESPRLRVDVPESPTPRPVVLAEPLKGREQSSGARPSPDGVGSRDEAVIDTGQSRPYSASRPIPQINPRHPRRVSRTLAVVALFVSVICVGVVLGMLWSFRERESVVDEVSYSSVNWTAEALASAEARSREYGLRPISPNAPIRVDYQLVRLDYPQRLQLGLRLTNRSSSPVTVLNVQTTWHLIHDDLTTVHGDVDRFDPVVSLAEPLAPGSSAVAEVTLTTNGPPLGWARESFVWIDITATDQALEILYSGGGSMIDLPVATVARQQ